MESMDDLVQIHLANGRNSKFILDQSRLCALVDVPKHCWSEGDFHFESLAPLLCDHGQDSGPSQLTAVTLS